MKKKKILAMFLTIAMAASMAACGGSSEPASGGGSASESGETAAPGEEKLSSRDTLNMACKSEPTSLDPAQTKDLVTWMFMYNVSDPLLYFNWETQEYEGAVATDWEPNEDGTEWTFTI